MSRACNSLVIVKTWTSACYGEYMRLLIVCSLNRFQSYTLLQIYKYIHKLSHSRFHHVPHLPMLHIMSSMSGSYHQSYCWWSLTVLRWCSSPTKQGISPQPPCFSHASFRVQRALEWGGSNRTNMGLPKCRCRWHLRQCPFQIWWKLAVASEVNNRGIRCGFVWV